MLQLQLFDDEPEIKLPEKIGRARVNRSESTSLLTPGKGRTDSFDFTLNTYRGCSFDCSYCYAPSFVGDEKLKEDWGEWVDAKVRAVEVLAKKDLRGKSIFMSSVTDPYQPLEQKVELTRAVVEELLRQQAHLIVQTRSPIVERDIDLLKRFDTVRVNLSITTDDELVRKRFEPSCASIERRLQTIIRLKEAGIRTGICISPMLPMKHPEEFARRIARIAPSHVTSSYFNFSDKAFASDTRQKGVQLAEEMGWDKAEYDRTVWRMRRFLPQLTTYGEGFEPERPSLFVGTPEKISNEGTDGNASLLYSSTESRKATDK